MCVCMFVCGFGTFRGRFPLTLITGKNSSFDFWVCDRSCVWKKINKKNTLAKQVLTVRKVEWISTKRVQVLDQFYTL